MTTVERIVARVSLSHGGDDVERAVARAAEGDPDWQLWVDNVERGLGLVLEVDISVEVSRAGQTRRVVSCRDNDIWVEKHGDPPKVEEQVRQIVGKGFPAIAAGLRAEGLEISECDLDEMYVHIELDTGVREAIATLPTLVRGPRPRPPGVPGPPW